VTTYLSFAQTRDLKVAVWT